MPRLACWSCGRAVYAADPVDTFHAAERRCPGCGLQLRAERRSADRRFGTDRRAAVAFPPGSPGGIERRRGHDRRILVRRVAP